MQRFWKVSSLYGIFVSLVAMAKNEYVCRFCVLLIILYANVNGEFLFVDINGTVD
jgi:hypothetical protein